MVTNYFNKTIYSVKIKTEAGKVTEVKPGTGITAPLGEVFTKQKFPGMAWRSL